MMGQAGEGAAGMARHDAFVAGASRHAKFIAPGSFRNFAIMSVLLVNYGASSPHKSRNTEVIFTKLSNETRLTANDRVMVG